MESLAINVAKRRSRSIEGIEAVPERAPVGCKDANSPRRCDASLTPALELREVARVKDVRITSTVENAPSSAVT